MNTPSADVALHHLQRLADAEVAAGLRRFFKTAPGQYGHGDIYLFYFDHIGHINNWDSVDASAPPLVGGYLSGRSRRPLYRLAGSASLWERRIAIVAPQHLIRNQDFADTLRIAEQLLDDREDLLHKAGGDRYG